MSVIIEYFEALARLKTGKTIRVPAGTKITNNSVALEAGRKEGSIKKSREVFSALIDEINEAADEAIKPVLEAKIKLEKQKSKTEHYRQLYEETIGREIMLLKKIDELEEELSKRRMSGVIKLQPKTPQD